jgi:hypothetical protein
MRPTGAAIALVERFFSLGKPTSTEGHYKRAAVYRRIFIGDQLRWKRWTGFRIDFNPSKILAAGYRILADLIHASRDVRITRVDVAVDLALPLHTVQAIGTSTRRAAGVSSGEGVETIYIGDYNGARSFAIYDKASEHHRRLSAEGAPVPHRALLDDLTRFEARLKKLRLRPAQLASIVNPFQPLRLLWLGGEDLGFVDRVLVRLARVVGFPLLANQLPEKKRERLLQRLLNDATAQPVVPHPREVFDGGWRTEATRVLGLLGLTK